jgi:hypothetical protein
MSPKILISSAALLNGVFAVVIVIGDKSHLTYWIVLGSRVLVGLFLVNNYLSI